MGDGMFKQKEIITKPPQQQKEKPTQQKKKRKKKKKQAQIFLQGIKSNLQRSSSPNTP